MGFFKIARLLVIAVLLQSVIAETASADTILRCDGCSLTQYRATARSGPVGYTYVIDMTNSELSLWQVHFEQELGKNLALGAPVDPALYDKFLFTIDKKVEAVGGDSNIVINIRAGEPAGVAFPGGNPLGGFENSSAYDVVNSVTVRNMLGRNIAQSMAGATTSSTQLNDLAVTLNSVLMSLTSPFSSQVSFTLVITWKDGTTTTFEIDSSSANQAEYVEGKSQDQNSNPIPDASITSSAAGGTYGGQYHFDTTKSLSNWVNAAIDYGIPVTGQASGSNRMSCTWDGRTLQCSYM